MKKGLSLLMTLVLVCGLGIVPATANAKAKSAQTVKITVGCWSSSPAEDQLLDNQIKALEAKYPEIDVQKQVITGDFNQAMQAKIASKTAPDVYYLDVSLASMYIKKGVLEPLNSYLDKKDLKDFEPSLLSGYQSGGSTYGIPKDYNTLVLFYNKDMLKSAGVKVPTTWSQLQDAAKKLTTDKVKGLVLSNDIARIAPFVYQAGGDINRGDTPIFNSTAGIKGFNFYYSFIKNGYAATPKDLGDGWNGDSFAHEKAAMTFEGGWMIPFMKESAPKINYGMARLPKGDKDGDLAFTVAYVMNKNCKNKPEAAKVITYLTGKDAMKMVADSGLAIPTRISMGNVYTSSYPERKALVDMADVSHVYNFGAYTSKINDAYNNAAEAMWVQKGNGDAKSLLNDAIRKAMK